ncbi:iron-sulfur cluster assembly scaffold protein [Peribacillus frigoritolerans]|nr:iron-sulfur cluster assembly scaffold protein [Peribacillus frigoritolerans]
MYNEIITEHFMNPRNIGELEHPSRVIKIGNAVCGDTIILHIAYNNNQEITDVRYKAYGCATSIATVSVCLVNLYRISVFPICLPFPRQKSRLCLGN